MFSRSRGITTLCAWLCMALHIGAMIHGIVVQHTTCVEHGEIIHAGEVHHVGHANSSHALIAEASDEQHDAHCALAVLLRNVVLDAPASVAHATGVHATADPVTEQSILTQVAIYALAPKNSPPV